MIEGVRTKSLKVIPDERGRVMEILRADDEFFQKFGQAYITTTYPQVVKAWQYHKLQTEPIAAVRGMIKLVLYDSQEDSTTKISRLQPEIVINLAAFTNADQCESKTEKAFATNAEGIN